MHAGFATPEGTARFATRHKAAKGHFQVAQGLTLSSVGQGSYLGATTSAARAAYTQATEAALAGGLNVLDTAANYRDQASERDVGRGIQRFLDGGGRRDEVLVSTKAGFLHGDVDEADQDAWFAAEYVEPGILDRTRVRSGHSLHPGFIRRQLERSRRNLGLETVDVMFLHNPEHQLDWVDEATFLRDVEEAFVALEEAADAGHIRMYGVATWDGLRTPPEQKGHLPLVKLVHHAGQARMRVGGKAGAHHFRALQLPVNAAMTEAALRPTQPWRFGQSTPLECAKDLGCITMASASLMQMRLGRRLPNEFADAFGTRGEAQTLLQFTRSVPGVTTALVGMGTPEHAAANAAFSTGTPTDTPTVKTLLGTGSIHGD